jgi:hypothetical protein
MGWVRNGKFFAMRPGEKTDVPQAKRAIGIEGDEEFFSEYMNQILEEAHRVDYILGSATDLTLGNANVKWNGSVFKDENDVDVVFASGDRIAIVSFDGGSVTFTTDNLHFDMEPDTEIDLTSIAFTLSGDGCRGRLNFVNASQGSIILSGANSFLDIRHDSASQAISKNGQDVLENGRLSDKDFAQNLFYNAHPDANQRGDQPTVGNSVYAMDGWIHNKTGAMVSTFQVSADGPTFAQSGVAVKKCIDLTTTTIDASIAAGDYCAISQPVEGHNIISCAGGFATLGFWVKSPVTGIHCVSFRNQGSGAGTFASPFVPDRSYIKEYTIAAINTWEFQVFTIPVDDSSGTWNYDTGMGLAVTWTLAAGTTWQTTSETWATGNFLATSNQVNAVGVVGSFKVGIPNLLAGEEWQRFRNSNSDEMYRYFSKTYPANIKPGSPAQTLTSTVSFPVSTAHFYDIMTFEFKEKRTTPIATFYNPSTGAVGSFYDISASVTRGVPAIYTSSTNNISIYSSSSTLAVNNIHGVHATFDAAIYI